MKLLLIRVCTRSIRPKYPCIHIIIHIPTIEILQPYFWLVPIALYKIIHQKKAITKKAITKKKEKKFFDEYSLVEVHPIKYIT